MSIVCFQQPITSEGLTETMFPPLRAPFFLRARGTSRFPAPLPAHRPAAGL
jgi:hypothetical protein